MKSNPEDDGASGASPQPSGNPHDWITPEVLREFLSDRGVSFVCDVCSRDTLQILDAGNEELIGSLPAYGRLQTGTVDTNNSIHMPVARLICLNCGFMRLHSLYIIETWRQLKATGHTGPMGKVVP